MKKLTFAVFLFGSIQGFSAFHMEGKVSNLGKSGEGSKVAIWIDPVGVKSEVDLFESPVSFLFKTGENEMWIINPKSKSYTAVSETINKLKMATDALKNVMKDLPAEQQKAYLAQLEKLKGPKPVAIKYKKVASKQKVGSWLTSKYEGYRGKEKVTEIWELDQKSPITPKEMEALKSMEKFSQSMSSNEEAGAIPPMGQFKSIIVKVLAYKDKKAYSQFLLTSFKRQGVENSFFELPSDYTKTSGVPLGNGK